MNRKTLLRACASATVMISAMSSAALAQDTEATEVGEIVVTGTSIRGVAAVGSPTAVLDVEEMKQSGATTASDMARLLPQVLNLGADETRNSFTGGAQDAAANATAVRSVNLRGIGPEATLLLVNGRRLPPSGVIKAISDLDAVPTSALARMEVVPDGASAIYGSDAVAGVVNLITRRNYDGAETVLRYGGADGLEQFVFSQTYGRVWDGGGFFFTYEKNKRSNLSGADRAFASQNRTARGGSDARPFTAAPGNILINPTTGGACTIPGPTPCQRYALPDTNGVGVSPAAILPGANRFDEGAWADLLPSQDRDSVLFNVQHQITDRLDVWYEGFYTRRIFDLEAPPALFALTVTSANPYFVRPAGAPAGTSQTVEYRFLDDNDSSSDGHERLSEHAVGFGLNLTDEWRLTGVSDYGWNKGLQRRKSVLNNAVLRAALLSTNPATAFNPFGDGTFNRANNEALVEAIDGERLQYAESTIFDHQLKVDGPLGSAPGGPIKLALGAEYHDNTFDQKLLATNVTADASVSTKLVYNERHIFSTFAEVFVPLVGADNAMPFVRRLDLSLAGRYEEYSDFGDTKNPKVGLVWGPTEDLNVRATWGTSFRAPSLVDSADQIKNIFIQNLTNTVGTVRGIFYNGGNSDLGPEEATTWTAGFDWTPKAVDGLRITATYYNIEYSDRIDVVPNTALTNPAYAPFVIRRPTPGVADAAFDALVAELLASPDLQNPVEPILNINAIIDGRRQNLGSMRQDGVDLSVAYLFSNDIGDWTLGLDISKILNLTRITAPGSPRVDVLDTFGNPVDLRVRGQIGWNREAWSANAFLNYIDEYKNTAGGGAKVDDWTTIDASVSYRFGDEGVLKGTRVVLSGQNIFDRDPPVVLNGTLSWDSQAHSPVGRFVSLELSKTW